ncbi:hypothetical protein TRICHSKD4_1701 [Roseibium sp. TrichSKD4]|nr:hypothetical protein TRICHSKD4_1701 [Roseibium sp. TrichSKD4]
MRLDATPICQGDCNQALPLIALVGLFNDNTATLLQMG